MFKNQPKGLYVLALANTGERFGYYTMLAILLLFLQAKFELSTAVAGTIYSTFLALVYFMPLIGGIIADKWNFQKTVTLGIIVMFLGYLVMAIPTEAQGGVSAWAQPAFYLMLCALLLISAGTGLFKGNLQVMVGDLYNEPKYAAKRDVAFSLFYMAINIGAMFAPSVTTKLCEYALGQKGLQYAGDIPGLCNKFISGGAAEVGDKMERLTEFAGTADTTALLDYCRQYMETISTGYSYAFAVACLSMIVSFLIYKLGKKTYAGIGLSKKEAGKAASHEPELTREQTKSRITALLLVFFVVIFFWMVFHQNGLTLTKFAQQFTDPECYGWTRIGFNIWALAVIAVGVYATFGVFQSKGKGRVVPGIILAACLVGLYFFYQYTPDPVAGVQPQIYQQFNPFYVVALTPFSVAIFSWLAKKKKEPSAPRKIGYGMVVAGIGFAIMAIGSFGLGTAPKEGMAATLVSPNWLMSTYLVLTFAELLLSPMGISFVSKVAPPKYKGMMMGCWFGATAIGNLLTAIPAMLWDVMDVAMIWVILIALCLLSAGFIFAIMKKLEAATADSETPPPADKLENVEDDAI